MNDLNRTEALQKRCSGVMSGPHSNLRVPINIRPNFIVKGKGARLWDVDGKEYIDYMIAAGPGILGHGNTEFIDALKSQLDTLYYSVSGASQTPIEVKVAEKIVQHVPCAEKVRFCLSGTEAVQLAIRLARAYTGRRYFIRFEGAYHGWMDNVLGGVVNENPIEHPFPREDPDDPLGTEGRDPSAFEQCFRIPYNDIDTLESVLEKWGDQVAMILVEPIQAAACISPRPGYLEQMKKLCNIHGIVLCFDEIVTGFRLAIGGAQEALGITPDLAVYGKTLGAGIPVAAVAGETGIMDQLLTNKVIGAGTFNGYPFGMAAALVTLKILEHDNGAVYRHIDKMQTQMMKGLKEILQRQNRKAILQHVRGFCIIHFTNKETIYSVRDLKEADKKLPHDLRVKLADEGVLIMWGGRWYFSAALTEADVIATLEHTEKALGLL